MAQTINNDNTLILNPDLPYSLKIQMMNDHCTYSSSLRNFWICLIYSCIIKYSLNDRAWSCSKKTLHQLMTLSCFLINIIVSSHVRKNSFPVIINPRSSKDEWRPSGEWIMKQKKSRNLGAVQWKQISTKRGNSQTLTHLNK